jgi:long-chain-fatty-acid--CoA ligase ACSBG
MLELHATCHVVLLVLPIRYKELIIGAGGENVAPVPLEDNVKKLCPVVSNIMMVGDKRKFNTAIVTLKCVGATGELPGTDQLLPQTIDPAVKTVGDAIKSAAFTKAITEAIEKTNKDGSCCPSPAAAIQRYVIVSPDFSVEGDELTATLKLKRSVVEKKFIKQIDAMYEANLGRGEFHFVFK